MTQLQVLICTIGEDGINRVVNTYRPEVEGVEYLISWQQPDEKIEIPEELAIRKDYKVYITKSKGLCKNRNYAIQCASAPLCLISDDDVSYKTEELTNLISVFDKNPNSDIITVKYHSENYPKAYPDYSFNFPNVPKGYYVTSFEIAFRLAKVKNRIKMNENFGIGATVFKSGEEDIFIFDAFKNGLNLRFEPIFVGTHNHSTTGDRDNQEPYFWKVKGAVFYHLHRRTWLPRIIVNAWRESKKTEKTIFYFLKYAFAGIIYARRNNVFKE